MAELGLDRAKLIAEVDKINGIAKTVEDDARNLAAVAKKISAKGIQGVSWYDGTFSQMLSKLEGNKVSEAVAEINLQSKKLVDIETQGTTWINEQ